LIAVFFHYPLPVVGVHEASDRLPYLLKIPKHPAINDLLLEGPDKTFGHPIGLRLFDKPWVSSKPVQEERMVSLAGGINLSKPGDPLESLRVKKRFLAARNKKCCRRV
jgi:hypothetical protein